MNARMKQTDIINDLYFVQHIHAHVLHIMVIQCISLTIKMSCETYSEGPLDDVTRNILHVIFNIQLLLELLYADAMQPQSQTAASISSP